MNLFLDILNQPQQLIYQQERNNHYYFDSPQPQSYYFQPYEESQDQPISNNHPLKQDTKGKHTKVKHQPKINKVNKVNKIKTTKNSHKFYHDILKKWLIKNDCKSMINKFAIHYDKRVYFILVLDQIFKEIDGSVFLQTYKTMAQEVITKKLNQIQSIKYLKDNCEQIQHLQRVIMDVEYSVKACHAFMEGRAKDALQIIYTRHQSKIESLKKFEAAAKVYVEVTGNQLRNM